MPSLIDIRRRIRSVRNTQQITKAMKMVSTARLRRAQERVVMARPYARILRELVANVAAAVSAEGVQRPDKDAEGEEALHPLLATRPEQRILLLFFTADRGLAGAFNSNLIKAAQRFLAEHSAQRVELELVGRKGRDFFKKRAAHIAGEQIGLSNKALYDDIIPIVKKVIDRYAAKEIDAVYLLYNEFRSVLSQKLTVIRVLPIEVPPAAAEREYIYEQPPLELLAQLLPRYVGMALYHALLESTAAEQAARMTAMDAATTNAGELIEKLTLFMNRVRQASITREIIEVVSGAAALE
jgi:F-type H+-transporting ATPase subunit gamma